MRSGSPATTGCRPRRTRRRRACSSVRTRGRRDGRTCRDRRAGRRAVAVEAVPGDTGVVLRRGPANADRRRRRRGDAGGRSAAWAGATSVAGGPCAAGRSATSCPIVLGWPGSRDGLQAPVAPARSRQRSAPSATRPAQPTAAMSYCSTDRERGRHRPVAVSGEEAHDARVRDRGRERRARWRRRCSAQGPSAVSVHGQEAVHADGTRAPRRRRTDSARTATCTTTAPKRPATLT